MAIIRVFTQDSIYVHIICLSFVIEHTHKANLFTLGLTLFLGLYDTFIAVKSR